MQTYDSPTNPVFPPFHVHVYIPYQDSLLTANFYCCICGKKLNDEPPCDNIYGGTYPE